MSVGVGSGGIHVSDSATLTATECLVSLQPASCGPALLGLLDGVRLLWVSWWTQCGCARVGLEVWLLFLSETDDMRRGLFGAQIANNTSASPLNPTLLPCSCASSLVVRSRSEEADGVAWECSVGLFLAGSANAELDACKIGTSAIHAVCARGKGKCAVQWTRKTRAAN
eukprot:279812-Rhodomonas_salina.1